MPVGNAQHGRGSFNKRLRIEVSLYILGRLQTPIKSKISSWKEPYAERNSKSRRLLAYQNNSVAYRFRLYRHYFYSWGMGGASTSASGAVATVDGAKISAVEYESTFNNLVNFYRERFRDQFSDDLIQKLDLKRQSLDALIQKKLLLLEADKQNLRVSDREVVSQIRNFDAFKKDKEFDQNLYDGFLRYRRLTPLEFEESQREALLIEKVEGFIKTNVKVSETEVDTAFEQENEKVKINYVVFPHDHFKSSEKVTEEEVRSFYETNKKRFEIPEQIKVEFVKITSKDYEGEIDIRDEDIEDYYKTKIADFRVPKQFTAAHILFTIDPPKDDSKLSAEEAAKEAEEAAKKEADEVLKKIHSGADFGELAKKHSDDHTSGEKEEASANSRRG